MNAVINAALELCGHPCYRGQIIAVCADALDLSDDLAVRLDSYLCRFH